MNKKFWLGVAAYVLPTFPLGYLWHLTWFAPQYQALQIYRPDLIFLLGLFAIIVQGMLLSWLYPKVVSSDARSSWLRSGLIFAAGVGLFAWTFSTVAVAAKNIMTSVPLFLALETGFTILHYSIVGPLIALAHRR
ncbi:MAG: hypothetical protein K8F62_18455 [Pseudorhodoplanes sp.]|nr:hypothetical protein [Pseudorhodoplanes sp.]